MKSISNAIIVGFVLCSAACGSAPVGEESEAQEESTATLLFSSSFADGGVMKVVEQDNGALGFVVRAPIGSEASKLAFEAGKHSSLLDVYTTLHAGNSAPQLIRDLNSKMELQKSAVPAVARPALATPLIDVEKTEDSFNTSFSGVSDGVNFVLILEQCKYRHVVNVVTTDAIVDSDNANLIDPLYVLNDATWTATHKINTSTWQLSLPAGNWEWVEWGGVYTGGVAKLQLPSGKNGPIGITVHDNRFR